MGQPSIGRLRTSRWRWAGLVLALCLLFLAFHGLERAVLAWVVEPESRRPGWLVFHYPDEAQQTPAADQRHSPPSPRLEIEQPHTSLRAYALLRVTRPGPHRLVLTCDDYGSLHLDGQRLIKLQGISAENSGEAVADLRAGPHLLRVDLHNGPGRGFFAIEMNRPGEMEAAPPRVEELGYPDLGNLEVWWWLLRQTQAPAPALAAVMAALLLWLALPLATGRGAAVALALAVALLAPSVLIFEPRDKHPFEYHHLIQALHKNPPRHVFIGNSMVDYSIDLERFNQLTGSPSSMTLTMGGTRSAIHFLFFKNVLLASGVRPELTFVFFRDNNLTNPLLDLGAHYNPAIFESLCPGPEPLLDQLVLSHLPWHQRWANALLKPLGAVAYQVESREAMTRAAQALATGRGGAGGEMLAAVNQRFAIERLRSGVDEATLAEAEAQRYGRYDPDLYLDFDRVVEASFLPHFISLARQHGLRLFFIRHQRRPDAEGRPPGDARLDRYMERLRHYLAAEGVGFHDFTGDPELPLALYGVGDHIADGAAKRYTEVFFRRLQGALKP